MSIAAKCTCGYSISGICVPSVPKCKCRTEINKPTEQQEAISNLEFSEIKQALGNIFMTHISMNETGTAIEGNPAVHRMAEWVHKKMTETKAAPVLRWVKADERLPKNSISNFAYFKTPSSMNNMRMPIQEYFKDSRVKHFSNGIDMALLNEEWARNNHGQSLDRLAERGGLSPCEAIAIISRRRWNSIPDDVAVNQLKEIIKIHESPKEDLNPYLTWLDKEIENGERIMHKATLEEEQLSERRGGLFYLQEAKRKYLSLHTK